MTMTKLASFFNDRSGFANAPSFRIARNKMMRKLLITFSVFAVLPALLLATGSAFAGTVRIVVPAHDIPRGDTIGESDLTYTTVDGAALMAGVPTKIEEVKGMQA